MCAVVGRIIFVRVGIGIGVGRWEIGSVGEFLSGETRDGLVGTIYAVLCEGFKILHARWGIHHFWIHAVRSLWQILLAFLAWTGRGYTRLQEHLGPFAQFEKRVQGRIRRGDGGRKLSLVRFEEGRVEEGDETRCCHSGDFCVR